MVNSRYLCRFLVQLFKEIRAVTKPEKILGLLVLFAGFGIQAARRRGLPSDLKNVAVTAGLSALWGLCVFGCWLAVKAALILHKEDIKEIERASCREKSVDLG